MNNSLVTVVMTTYKRSPDTVLRALESVRRQSYKNIEIIIVDDSPVDYEKRKSIDEAIEQIDDNRIILLINEKNIGACASRNRAINISKGEYVMYVDDDDEITVDNIEKKLLKFSNTNIGLVYSDCIHLDDSTNSTKVIVQEKHKGKIYDKLILNNFIGAFPLVRKECFFTCGMFDEMMESAQDYDMWLRIAQKYEIDYVDEPLAIVHIHRGERISNNPIKKINGLERINQKNRQYIQEHRHCRHLRIIKIVPYYAAAKRWKNAFGSLLKGILLDPLDFRVNLAHSYVLIKSLLSR